MARYITELANDIAKSCPDLVENGCGNDNCVACLAFKLIGLGYKKQDNTADVVPKSEVDKLEYTLIGVMHSVDKWLDGEELKQDEVNRAITMREKTLRIIEDAKSEIERLEKDNKKLTINMNAFGLTAIRQKEEKDALAREIFEEIESHLVYYPRCCEYSIDERDYEKIKKKYTKESEGER